MQFPIALPGSQFINLMNFVKGARFIKIFKPLQPSFAFSNLKEKMKDMRKSRIQPKTEILSLSPDQLLQLSNIDHYTASVQHLQNNELGQAKKKLQFALNEASSRFPESVNLHMCLINRLSILQKLGSNHMSFVQKLEKLFFMSYSLRGEKSIQTLKHLQNYLASLLLFFPNRSLAVVEFLRDENAKVLLKKTNWLVGIAQFYNGEPEEGIDRIKDIEGGSYEQQAIRLNALGWMQLLQASNFGLEYCVPQQKFKVKEALKNLVKALVLAQKGGDLEANPKEIEINLQMLEKLEKFEQNENSQVLKTFSTDTLLMNSQSHIIAMNIAHSLFLLRLYQQAIVFMKIGLENAIKLQEHDRLGLSLVLMAKINHRLKVPWEPILLDLLQNRSIYSPAVLKEALSSYSRFLFTEHRYYEAENYINQSEQFDGNILAEGLYLPEFDFSF